VSFEELLQQDFLQAGCWAWYDNCHDYRTILDRPEPQSSNDSFLLVCMELS